MREIALLKKKCVSVRGTNAARILDDSRFAPFLSFHPAVHHRVQQAHFTVSTCGKGRFEGYKGRVSRPTGMS